MLKEKILIHPGRILDNNVLSWIFGYCYINQLPFQKADEVIDGTKYVMKIKTKSQIKNPRS